MIPGPANPIIRQEVEELLEAESLIRKARRSMIADPENPPKGGAGLAVTLITNAIAHLVAARALLDVMPDAPKGKTP